MARILSSLRRAFGARLRVSPRHAENGASSVMTRASRFLAVAALALGALHSCARRPRAPAPVRIAVHSGPISLDPHLQNEVLTFGVLANLYDGLTVLDSDLRVRPGLVTTWENPDDRTWRFHLRPEARFSDGRHVTADDVVFSVERGRTHPRSQLQSYLVEIESVRARDSRTVELVTRRPFGALANKLAFLYVVPRGSPAEITSPIGSGPYRVASYEKGRSLGLEPVPNGWRGRAPALPLEFRPISSAAERAERLLAGEIDLAQDLETRDEARLAASGRCRVARRPSTVVEYLHLGAAEPLFDDHRVRQAISLALDRERLIAAMVGGQGRPASQMVGPGIFGYEPSLVSPRRDLAAARRLLAEAGHPDGISLTLEQRADRHGEEIARQLGEAGITVRVVTRPWSEMFARLRGFAVGFYYGGVAAVTADASDIFDSFAHTRAGGYGSSNYASYSNAELDRLIEESGAAMQPDRRRGILQMCMHLLMQDLRFVPLYVRYDEYGIDKRLEWEPRVDRMLLGSEMRRVE
jgi:peptide/nickel transport system substrate-binding protein